MPGIIEQGSGRPAAGPRDEVQPFMLEATGFRGRLLRLGPKEPVDGVVELGRADHPFRDADALSLARLATSTVSSIQYFRG